MIYNILNIGRNGLKGMQNDIDNTSSNIANANTYGYKAKKASFQELLLNETSRREVLLDEKAEGLSINAGVKNGVHKVNHKQGNLYETGREFDLAIEGDGFFLLKNPKNEDMLTRNGSFHINEDNSISNDEGYYLDLDIRVPINQWGNEKKAIGKNGEITTTLPDGSIRLLGRVNLYGVEARGALLPIDGTKFYPGEGANLRRIEDGHIIQGYLEGSNVDLVESMVELITSQRAYSGNAKFVQTTDDMLMTINNLKR